MPVPQARAIARQIAEAFAAAHEKGIVHGDLKPADIVVQGAASGAGHGSDDVRVKVLDFGCELPDRPLLRAVRPGK